MAKRVIVRFATAFAATALSLVSWTASAYASEPDFQILVNDRTDKCIDVAGHSAVAGGVLHEWDCGHDSNSHNQHWGVRNTNSSGFFNLVVHEHGFCMAEHGLNAQLTQENCDGRSSELWRWAPDASAGRLWLQSVSGLCVALIPNTVKNGTPIGVQFCSDSSASHWHAEPTQ
ncbi:RICIN domain-containing protein [Lentzea sp. NPDC004789]